MGGLPLVHALRAALVNDALGVGENDVVVRHTHGFEQFDGGDRRGACAIADEAEALQVSAGELERIDKAGGRDNRSAMLVVMEDRDVHELAQLLLDYETIRRLYVLQIDAAEGRAEIAHRIDEGVRILGVDLEIDRVDICKALEQHGL